MAGAQNPAVAPPGQHKAERVPAHTSNNKQRPVAEEQQPTEVSEDREATSEADEELDFVDLLAALDLTDFTDRLL